ncbi:MAG: class II fructose-bisphosphatase [Candidatus Eremiobacteraeota bacterium]|nr:class II fructose-bisphosphatase [Candidatus Eremiobacteraeota bacterium]
MIAKNDRGNARIEFEFVRATETAAVAAGRLVGRGDKNGIDQLAVDAMRAALSDVDVDGTVVIGEGEKDQAPMLFHGERLGTGDGPALDIAVDPIDGTTLASKGGAGAISVVAAATRDSLFRTRVPYMNKIVVGAKARGSVSLDADVGSNVLAVARALGRAPGEITVALLDRPRNEQILREIREVGARTRVFSDGDVATAIIAVLEDRGRLDMLMGIGGSPEGVLTACAVKALGGNMQGRLWLRDDGDREIAREEDIDPDALLTLNDLCRSDYALLAATGVTDGELLGGVRYGHAFAYTESIIVSTFTHTMRTLTTKHDLDPRTHFARVTQHAPELAAEVA